MIAWVSTGERRGRVLLLPRVIGLSVSGTSKTVEPIEQPFPLRTSFLLISASILLFSSLWSDAIRSESTLICSWSLRVSCSSSLLPVKFLVSGPVPIPLLRPGRSGWVLFDALDDIVCRPGSVVVTGELGTFIEDWFEAPSHGIP